MCGAASTLFPARHVLPTVGKGTPDRTHASAPMEQSYPLLVLGLQRTSLGRPWICILVGMDNPKTPSNPALSPRPKDAPKRPRMKPRPEPVPRTETNTETPKAPAPD